MKNVEKFITHNLSNWKELLAEKPYCIKVTQDGPYYMLKYNQIDSDFSLPIVQECRGLIVRFYGEILKIVCHPFDKFFNYGEANMADLDWKNGVQATEKVDGSLIKFWFDLGKWHISTNGTIDAYKAEANSAAAVTFGELVEQGIHAMGMSLEEFYSGLDKSYTHMFELVSPLTRVVIPYKETKLYYLTSRSNWMSFCGYYHFFNSAYNYPKDYGNYTSIEQLLPIVEKMDWQHEGLVLFDGINRIKLKSPAYVLAHYARANGNVSKKHLIKVILEGEEAEFLTYAEEYKDALYKIKYKMDILEQAAKSLYLETITFKDKKSLAMYLKSVAPALAGYAFKAYDNMPNYLSWKDYTSSWDAAKWEKIV